MIETSIFIEPYLAEYLRGKYNNGADEPVRIPDSTDLYHLIWNLMTRRPKNHTPVDKGNLTIYLPERRLGKDPEVFNFLSHRSAKLIEMEARKMFNRELHIVMEENDLKGRELRQIDVVHKLLCSYCIESISEDALLKNYYRWRENIRKRDKRKYERKLNKR